MSVEFGAEIHERSADRASGALIGMAAILSLAFMAHHPTVHARNTAEFLGAFSPLATSNLVVHGALIALMGVMVCGYWGMASRLGKGNLLVRAGFVAYAMGAASLVTAALINGFILTGLAQHYSEPTADNVAALKPLLTFCHIANWSCDAVGVTALSVAVVLWSIVLLGRSGVCRAVGLLGLIAGGLPAVALLSGQLPLDLHGVGAFLVCQATWSLAVSAAMIRNRI